MPDEDDKLVRVMLERSEALGWLRAKKATDSTRGKVHATVLLDYITELEMKATRAALLRQELARLRAKLAGVRDGHVKP